MKTFKLEDDTRSFEYCVLKCPACASIFRHDLTLDAFGKHIKNRMCHVCGFKVPVDDRHCLDKDPMLGEFRCEFKSAKEV